MKLKKLGNALIDIAFIYVILTIITALLKFAYVISTSTDIITAIVIAILLYAYQEYYKKERTDEKIDQ